MTEIKQIVVFNLDDRKFALPIHSVQRVIRVVDITPLPKAPDIVIGVINIEGDIIPVVDIRRRFRLPDRDIDLSDQIIICKTAARTVGILVSDVSSAIEIPEDSLTDVEKIVPGIEYAEGIAKLNDEIVLIHDIDKFLSLEEERALSAAIREITPDGHG